jgi:hypothetical protein
MRHFCTYFDRNYLSRGLALYESLRRHAPPFTLWVLCMDRGCHSALERAALPGVRPIALEEFERDDRALLEAKSSRSPIEYYFTCTPSLPLYVLRTDSEADAITYLDADLYFYADPSPLFAELGAGSIGIIEHDPTGRMPELAVYGRYNVGWITFRRDPNALACLAWWRERCIEWCHDRVEGGRFAEQKYLDEWPSRFRGVVVLAHPGANVAPWNLASRRIRRDESGLWVGESRLLFYHFHGLRRISSWLYDPNLSRYRARAGKLERACLYVPYVQAVRAAARRIAPHVERLAALESIRTAPAGSWPRRAARWARRAASLGLGVMAGRYIVAGAGEP